jgi:SEC-C motif-containing protein
MNRANITLCPCHSTKLFKKCCDRFLNAGQYPKTPKQLMRSRYSAYALGGYGDYLLATWLPAMSKELSAVQLSQKETEWIGLDVLTTSQVGNDGFVEFKGHYSVQDGPESITEKKVLHEKSVFKRIQGKWLYVGGEIT